MRSITIVLLLGLLAAGGGVAADDGEWNRTYEGYLPDLEATVVTVLVTDGRTGRPIEGAVVNRHPEAFATAAGWAPFEDSAVTDRFGLASIEVGSEVYPCHWVVHAEGYAPTEAYGNREDHEVELFPGRDRRGRIVDVFGAPVAGITVEYKIGCAHAPALRTATTDAEGVFTLPVVAQEGDITYAGPAVESRYGSARDLRPPPAPPPVLLALPGTTIRGRIVGADPFDLVGAVLLSDTTPRGPTAAIASDGSFVLEGADAEARIHAMFAGDSVPEEIDPRDHAPGRPLVVPAAGVAEPAPTGRVTVTLGTEAAGAVPAGVRVHLDRRSDGRRTTLSSEGGAPVVFAVAPGTFDLSAGGPFDRYVAAPVAVEVEDAPVPVSLVVREQPRLELAIPPPPVAPGREAWEDEPRLLLTLCLPGRTRRIWNAPLSEPVRLPDDVRLPPETPARVHLRRTASWARSRFEVDRAIPVAPARDGVRRAAFSWPEPPPPPPEEPAPGPTQSLRVVLPEGADAPYVAAIVYPETAGADGVYVEPDEDGLLRSAALVSGATVRLEGLPETTPGFVLDGPGPWTWRPGTAAIVVRIADREELETACIVDGDLLTNADDDGHYRVDRLAAGPHVVLVGAEGRLGRAIRVVLAEGETRTLVVALENR